MHIEIEDREFFTIIKITGKLNSETYNTLIDTFNKRFQSLQKDLILNLTSLKYISSAGLRSLLIIAKDIDTKGRKIVIYGLSEYIKEIFKLAGFSEIFPIYDDFESALKYLTDDTCAN